MASLRDAIFRILRFIKTDLWRIRLDDLSRTRSFLLAQLRILVLAVRGFVEDKCPLRASALTYYSLLSVVPVVAMLFGIAQGFGFQQRLESLLMRRFSGQEVVLTQILDFANSLLENTQGGLIAGIGIGILLWSVIKLLSNIELSFNDILNISKPRSFVRKFSDYLSIILIAPLTLIVASSTTVFIATQVADLSEQFAFLGWLSGVVSLVLQLLPYFLIWLLFSFVYMVMPNTKVSLKAAFLAGVVAGTIYQLTQWAYINFQVGVAKYNAIYGSFAALPLFLIWMQLSWFIVLFGAEVSFAIQNVDTFAHEKDARQISPFNEKLLSLLIAHAVVKRFAKGEKPMTGPQIASTLEIPIRLVRRILLEFVNCGLFSVTDAAEKEELAYQPASDINHFTVKYVLETLERRGATDRIPVAQTEELARLKETLDTFSDTIEKSPANRLLKDI